MFNFNKFFDLSEFHKHSGKITILFILFTVFSFSRPANAKYSGGTGEPNDPYRIATAADLIALGETTEDYYKHFILTADIDLDPNLPGRKVFNKAVIAPDTEPNDDWDFQGTAFTGVFDGNGYTISHLTIVGKDWLGLFGQMSGEVKDLGVVNTNIAGSGNYVGGLVGWNNGALTQCCSAGVVVGNDCVGGLVGGASWEGTIWDCYSTSKVSGHNRVGGLIGAVIPSCSPGCTLCGCAWPDISRCYSTGAVTGESSVGGLVGEGESPCDYL